MRPEVDSDRMNVVFDFGGVLFRWQPHEFLARLMPQRTQTDADTQALVADFFEGYAGDWGSSTAARSRRRRWPSASPRAPGSR